MDSGNVSSAAGTSGGLTRRGTMAGLTRRGTMAGLSRRGTMAGLAAVLSGCDAAVAGGAAGNAAPARAIDHRPERLLVGPDQDYPSLTLAGCRLQKKWTDPGTGRPIANPEPAHVIISPGPPGYYTNDSGSHSRRWPSLVGWPPYDSNLFGPVVIEGEPGKPPPDLVTDGYADGVLYYQAGLFITTGYDATFRRLHFSGFRRQDGGGNYAAVRLNPQEGRTSTVLFEDVEIDHCDDGIMGGDVGLSVILRRCHLHDNGNMTGLAHNFYLSNGDSLLAEDVLSTRCTLGHLLKSRASRTTIRHCRLLGQGGTESACLDVPDAGVLEIDGLVCEKSPDTDANWIIHYSGENQDNEHGVAFHVPSSVSIRDLTLIAPPAMRRHPTWGGMIGFANQSGKGDAASGAGSFFVAPDAVGVKVFGLTPVQAGLPHVEVLRARPVCDLTSPVRT